MKKRKFIHTIQKASTIKETLKTLGLTKKDFLNVIMEIKKGRISK